MFTSIFHLILQVVKGSGRLFSALLSRCHTRKMAPVCWYRPRSNSALELVYLLPQLEQRDERNQQTVPPGFHVIFAPFKEDMRELDVLEGSPSGLCYTLNASYDICSCLKYANNVTK